MPRIDNFTTTVEAAAAFAREWDDRPDLDDMRPTEAECRADAATDRPGMADPWASRAYGPAEPPPF